jgi:hypothetical protein
VTYKIGDGDYGVRFSFDNPVVGSNSFGCTVLRGGRPDGSAPYGCAVENTSGNQATPRFVVTAR